MKQIWCPFLALLLHLGKSKADDTHLTCLYCADVASPSDCGQSMQCGTGEICYAKEFTDHRGLKGFRLGCDDETRCDLFLTAKHLIGKRAGLSTDHSAHDLCYECCKDNECNAHLCQGKGVAHVPPTIPSNTECPSCPQTSCPSMHTQQECPSCTCPQPSCPPVTTLDTSPTTVSTSSASPLSSNIYKDSSYLLVIPKLSWTEARAHCKTLGADLVSINSQGEQDFISNHLLTTTSGANCCFWIGVEYNHAVNKFEWVDGTSLVYTNWWIREPDGQAHMIFVNPKYSVSAESGKWEIGLLGPYSYICEKQIM